MNKEVNRLSTFSKRESCSQNFVSSAAVDGFRFYQNVGGGVFSVICYFCGLILNSTAFEDDIAKAHKRCKPNCPMVTKIGCTNVPWSSKTFEDFNFFFTKPLCLYN